MSLITVNTPANTEISATFATRTNVNHQFILVILSPKQDCCGDLRLTPGHVLFKSLGHILSHSLHCSMCGTAQKHFVLCDKLQETVRM